MVQMELHKILIDEKRSDQLIIIKEKKGKRILPIVIGIAEASSIRLKLSGFTPPRPLTHDLIKDVFKGLGAVLEKIVIDGLEESTFFAKLHFKSTGGKKVVVDSRPSDSIALAVRTDAPIFVEEEVLEKGQLV